MEAWSKFIAHGLVTRLESSRFEQYVQVLRAKHPSSSAFLADILFRPTAASGQSLDPLVSRYICVLLKEDLLEIPSLLRTLLKYSTFNSVEALSESEKGRTNTLRWEDSSIHEEDLFYVFAKLISDDARPNCNNEIVGTVQCLAEWMRLLTTVAAHNGVLHQLEASDGHSLPKEFTVCTALGAVVVAMSDNPKVVSFLKHGCPKALRELSQALTGFMPLLSTASPISAERLEVFRSEVVTASEPTEKKTSSQSDGMEHGVDPTSELSMDSINVVDLPTVNSRAGLYIYLNSLLVGRPIIDDAAIFNYLHNRYPGDAQTTCTDLILSSFDVLANAIFRNEPSHVTIVLRSFLINKVPLLISALSASFFPPLTPEFCITQALGQVDSNIFPTFSSMFDDSSHGNTFSDSVRQDFCFACCLHGLIAEESIETLLGEIPMQTLPAGGRYVKDDLVQQCLSDPERAESLIEELEHMDGNVGAVSQAISQVIGHLCRNKETIALKTVCTHLVRIPSSMDILLLFDSPQTILQPICELLDGWRYDEDQGEYQPVYEEFGSILLLVLAFVHRYNLSTVDLGLYGKDSFIMSLLVKGAISRPSSELSNQERTQLDGWIRGLFNTEGGGLGDEPMSNCPPQDFYLLVPTLFNQVLLAYSTGHLNDEILKNGLEYLVDTFLLPFLVGVMIWLSNHLWEARGDTNAVLQIIQIVVNPGSISNEASMMLKSVLNIIAKPLEHSLRWLQRSEPSRQDIEPLLRALKPYLSFSRTTASEHTELEQWTSHPNGGLTASIRHTMSSLVQWSLTAGSSVIPTSYTHRQILLGIRMLGARRLINAIIDEVKLQTANGNSAIVFDVAAAIVCAPDAASTQPSLPIMSVLDDEASHPQPLQCRLSLRAALKTAAERAPKLYKDDVLQAETLIRLYRRVETQMVITMPLQISQPAGMLEVHDNLDGLGVGVGDPASLNAVASAMMAGGQEATDGMAGDGNILDAFSGNDMMDLADDDLLGMKLDF